MVGAKTSLPDNKVTAKACCCQSEYLQIGTARAELLDLGFKRQSMSASALPHLRFDNPFAPLGERGVKIPRLCFLPSPPWGRGAGGEGVVRISDGTPH